MSQLVSDPVFAALTRPQMIGGVTYSYAVLNLIVTIECFLISKSFLSLLIALVIHVAGVLGCVRDPRFFDIWLTRVKTCPRIKNFKFWSVNSYTP